MAEMLSMGVGNKALRDIAPSEEAISNRSINYVLKCRGSRQRAGMIGCGRPWVSLLGTAGPVTLSLLQKFALVPPLL